ncbi:hypothetical protein FACS1894130_01120 [Spirochaetia bacterium]|nr:hypothetical protein FACS1894130_01120 [Spirochaetia bacterium]
MKIEDLQETAALAHLNLDEAELAGAFPAFEQMLGFFAAMQAADEDRVAFSVPASDGHQTDDLQSTGSTQTVESGFFRLDKRPDGLQSADSARTVESGFFRLDKKPDGLQSETSNTDGINGEADGSNLLDNAGERDGRFIVVPNVL